jgi:hypothetical protein
MLIKLKNICVFSNGPQCIGEVTGHVYIKDLKSNSTSTQASIAGLSFTDLISHQITAIFSSHENFFQGTNLSEMTLNIPLRKREYFNVLKLDYLEQVKISSICKC